MLKKSKRRVGVRIDMTPMVDIAFLLLIFYMATTQFKPPEQKQVTLPMSTSQRDLPTKNFITVTLTKQDSVYLDYIIRAKTFDPQSGDSIEIPVREYTEAAPDQVGGEIQRMRAKALRQGIRDIYLVLKADKDASYGAVEKIMDSMQKENLTSFQVVTDLDPSVSRAGG
ncbi:MAG: biopolymer transporter ExbD [candidate division Zixibacteria bacterium]|nr:biopolymer transporter ExbD [candidate division Zixibacteria bacterium]